MSYPEYYKILNVSPSASMQDIRKSYRELAKKYHPDLNKNDKSAEEKLKKINEAYEVLKNYAKRAEYDYFGKQAEEAKRQYKQQEEQQRQTSGKAKNDHTIRENANYKTPFYLMLFRRIFAVVIFVIYVLFIYSNADKRDSLNIFKALSNSADLIVEKVLDAKDRSLAFYESLELRKKFLFKAVEEDWEKTVEFVLKKYPDAQLTDKEGYSLLMRAKTVKIAELLLKYGANINYQSPDGETAFSLAIKFDHRDLSKFLLANGAKWKFKSTKKNHETPEHNPIESPQSPHD